MWTDVVRRKHIDDAIVQCEMAHKKAAKICLKVRDKSLRMIDKLTAAVGCNPVSVYTSTVERHTIPVALQRQRRTECKGSRQVS